MAAVYPLIKSGVLDFKADSATFSIDRTPLNYTSKGFDREVTACFKIKESTEAEFILISETYVS